MPVDELRRSSHHLAASPVNRHRAPSVGGDRYLMLITSPPDRRDTQGKVRQRDGGGAADVAFGLAAPSSAQKSNLQAAHRRRSGLPRPLARLLRI